MNRADIRALVTATTGRSDKDSVINSAINMALRKISAQRLWSDLLVEGSTTFTPSVQAVALAANLRRLVGVRVINGLNSYDLPIRTKRWIDLHYPSGANYAVGFPRVAYLLGTSLVTVPAADSAYTVTYSYYRVHPDLSDDSTELLISLVEDAVISFATYWVFKSIQEHEDAAQWLGDYNLQLRDAKHVDSQNSAVKLQADPRGYENEQYPPNYQNDPFFKTMGGI